MKLSISNENISQIKNRIVDVFYPFIDKSTRGLMITVQGKKEEVADIIIKNIRRNLRSG